MATQSGWSQRSSTGQRRDSGEEEPDDAEGWARLVRSYMVLERPDDARTALEEARAALADDQARIAVVEAAAKALGIAD